MNKKKTLFAILIIVLLPTVILHSFLQQATGTEVSITGPKIDTLTYKIFPLFGFDQEQQALTSGQIDMIPTVASFQEAANLSSNSNLVIHKSIAGSTKLSSIFFNLRKSPCNDTAIRLATSYLVDRTYICNNLLGGWVNPVKNFIPPLSPNWTNNNSEAPDFDSQKARQILDNAGYEINSLGWRNIPNSNITLDTLTVLSPTWTRSSVLWYIAYTLSYYLNATGVPTYHTALPDYVLLERTMERRDFDICVMDVSIAQVPFGLYPLLHSSQDYNGTFAFPGIHNQTLDSALETLWLSNNKANAQTAALQTQTYLQQLLPYIPVCSTPQISAQKSTWTGAINMPGLGADNFWTYLNLHPNNSPFGGSFTLSTIGNLSTLNPCIALQANEWSLLQRICTPLFYLDPSTLQETPLLAKSWTIENWTTPQAQNGMKITFNLEQNIVWQDNQPFTSNDIKFCIDYLKSNNATTFNNICNKILSTTSPNSSTIEIYVNATGYKHLYDMAWFTILPEHIWKNITNYQTFQPWTQTNPLNTNLTMLVGQGPFILKQCDLNNEVTLTWNPLFFMIDTDKLNTPTPSPSASLTPPPTSSPAPNPTSTPASTATPNPTSIITTTPIPQTLTPQPTSANPSPSIPELPISIILPAIGAPTICLLLYHQMQKRKKQS